MNPLKCPGRCALLGFLVLLAGCNLVPSATDDPTRYYLLSDAGVPAPASPATGGLRIGLRAVALEGYLKHREIIVRTGPNEVNFRDYHRWAEPLDMAIAHILAARLLAGPAVAEVWTEPFPIEQERDYDVFVQVTRFEGALAGSGRYTASLSATVEVYTAGTSPRLVGRKVFVAPDQAWDGRDFDHLAGLLSADVVGLAREILAELPAKG
jgi:uncharacterized lipoprotein YmbA